MPVRPSATERTGVIYWQPTPAPFGQFQIMKVFSTNLTFKHKLDLIQQVLLFYSLSRRIPDVDCKLRPKLIVVLSYYILNGYNDETKEMIQNLGINKLLLNQMNSELTRKKYLITDTKNLRKKHLAEDIKNLSEYFSNPESPNIFAIKFDEERKARRN